MTLPQSTKAKGKKRKMTDFLLFLLALALVIAMRQCLWTPMRVKGSSMLSTLRSGEWMLVSRVQHRNGGNGINRGDVVICHYPGRYWKTGKWKLFRQHFVKRVVALPGEEIEIVDSVVFINGKAMDESYLDSEHTRRTVNMSARTLGDDEYFVMGDNRDSSNDSRRVGAIRQSDIVGRVTRVLWPLSAWRKIE